MAAERAWPLKPRQASPGLTGRSAALLLWANMVSNRPAVGIQPDNRSNPIIVQIIKKTTANTA